MIVPFVMSSHGLSGGLFIHWLCLTFSTAIVSCIYIDSYSLYTHAHTGDADLGAVLFSQVSRNRAMPSSNQFISAPYMYLQLYIVHVVTTSTN